MVPAVATLSGARRVIWGGALTAAILLGLLVSSGHARAEDVSFCFNAWPPYAHQDGDTTVGLSVQVLDEASRRSGLVARYQELPWKRCLHEVRAGNLDAVIDAAAREEFLQGPTSYSVYTNTFWVRDDAPQRRFELEALRGTTVGLVTGYVYPEGLVKAPPFRIDYSVDDATALRKLAAGRVDAIVADLVSTLRAAKENALAVRPLLPSHSLDRLYPSFNPKSAAKQGRLDTALRQMHEDGTIRKIYRDVLDVDSDRLLGEPE